MKMELTGNRRSFLKHAAVLGGAALSLLLGRKTAAAAPVQIEPPAKEADAAGYRLTPHIKKYYETANL
jgi:hypothetical protein